MKLKKLMILSAISLPVVAFAMSAKKCGGDTATPAVPGLPGGSNNGTNPGGGNNNNPGGGNNTNPGGGNTQNPGTEVTGKAVLVETNESAALQGDFKYGDLSIDVTNATVTFDKEDFFSELKDTKKTDTYSAFFSYSTGKFQGKAPKGKKVYQGTPLFSIAGVDNTTQAVNADKPIFKDKNNKISASSWIDGKVDGDKITFKFRLFNFKQKTVSKNVYSITLNKK